MAKAQTYQRSELPPGQTGLMKPPYELADRTGQRRFGQTLSEISGDIWEKLIQTESALEYNEFIGQTKTAQAELENYVREHPAEPIEDYQSKQEEMMQSLKRAGENAKTGMARQKIREFYLANENLIRKQSSGAILAIRTQRDYDLFKVQSEALVQSGDIAELKSLYASISGNLMTPEQAQAELEVALIRAGRYVEAQREAGEKAFWRNKYQTWKNHFTVNNADNLTKEEALQGVEEVPENEIGDFRDNLRVSVRAWWDAKEIEKNLKIDDYKRDFFERVDTKPVGELQAMVTEPYSNDTLKPEDQKALSGHVADRIKYLKEGSNVISDLVLLGALSEEAVNLDPNSGEIVKFYERIEGYAEKGLLHPKDIAALKNDARTEFKTTQQASLNIGLQGARDLVRPLELIDRMEWIADRQLRGLSVKGKEAEQAFVEFIASQAKDIERQGLEEDLSRYAQQAMREYILAHPEAKPTEIDRELEYILRQYRRIRDQGMGAMLIERTKREGGERENLVIDRLKKQGLPANEITKAMDALKDENYRGGLTDPPVIYISGLQTYRNYERQNPDDKTLEASGLKDIPDSVWAVYTREQVQNYLDWAKKGYLFKVQDGKIAWLKP